jgi:hypothetical protein
MFQKKPPRSTALLLAWLLASADAASTSPTPEVARQLAAQAYVFAYASAEHGKALEAIAAQLPANFLHNRSTLLGPQDRTVVSPNNDTLYSYALLDLREQPLVLEVPAVAQRYYSFQLVDLRTDNLDYIGSRATGRAAGRFVIAGPDWQGSLPSGFATRLIRSPSQILLLLGRTAVNGADDLAAANAVTRGYRLQGLAQALDQAPAAPPRPLAVPAYRPTKEGPAAVLFAGFNALATWHAWSPREREQLARFAEIGVGPGLHFPPQNLAAEVAAALRAGTEDGREQVKAATRTLTMPVNGWLSSPANAGHYGADDLTRAATAWQYIYVNDAAEALYPIAKVDARGQPLDGHRAYRLRFNADQLPPVNAFWSLTLYDGHTQLFAANPLERYALGDRSEGLVYDADGGLTLHIQPNPPGAGRDGNWLPTPPGPFYLIQRLYLPQARALDDSYRLPGIQPLSEY